MMVLKQNTARHAKQNRSQPKQQNIKQNIRQIRQSLPDGIILLAATKSRSVDEIREAVSAGIRYVGENYVQEAKEKFMQLKDLFRQKKVEFHCIGHLQKNKVRDAIELFDMIQAVDSKGLADEINKRCAGLDKIMPVLVEVNIGRESGKNGCMPQDTMELCSHIIEHDSNLVLKGLMAMAPYCSDENEYATYFSEMKTIFDRVNAAYRLHILSMGMSDSYKIAVQHGANMVRLGVVIFEKRK